MKLSQSAGSATVQLQPSFNALNQLGYVVNRHSPNKSEFYKIKIGTCLAVALYG